MKCCNDNCSNEAAQELDMGKFGKRRLCDKHAVETMRRDMETSARGRIIISMRALNGKSVAGEWLDFVNNVHPAQIGSPMTHELARGIFYAGATSTALMLVEAGAQGEATLALTLAAIKLEVGVYLQEKKDAPG